MEHGKLGNDYNMYNFTVFSALLVVGMEFKEGTLPVWILTEERYTKQLQFVDETYC